VAGAEEPGRQKPRNCRAQVGPKQCPGKGTTEKGWPTKLSGNRFTSESAGAEESARLTEARETNVAEYLSALITDLGDVDAVLRQKRTALLFSEPHVWISSGPQSALEQLRWLWNIFGTKPRF
jgi:hypothetical protein